jgi:hypothetical protein
MRLRICDLDRNAQFALPLRRVVPHIFGLPAECAVMAGVLTR